MPSLLFQNTVILRRSGVANFADIIKIAIALVKITFELKSNNNHKLFNTIQILSYFLIQKSC